MKGGQYFTTAEPIDGGPEFELCIDYSYQPSEQATATYPGCFESVTIDLVCARKSNNALWCEFRTYTFLDYQMWMSEIFGLINEGRKT